MDADGQPESPAPAAGHATEAVLPDTDGQSDHGRTLQQVARRVADHVPLADVPSLVKHIHATNQRPPEIDGRLLAMSRNALGGNDLDSKQKYEVRAATPDRYGPQSRRRPSFSSHPLGTSFSLMVLVGPLRRRPSAGQAPSSGIRIHGNLPPPGVRRQFKGVLILLALPLLPGDVQMDVRVASVLRRRSRFSGPPVLRGVPDLQDGPSVELPGRPPAACPFPGPFGQFLDRRMVHPVDRDRLGLFAFQKDFHVDGAPARAVTTFPRKHTSAQVFVRIQLRRRRLDRSRPRVHYGRGRSVGGNTVQKGKDPAFSTDALLWAGGVRRRNWSRTNASGRSEEVS